jgi:hypothetical protein
MVENNLILKNNKFIVVKEAVYSRDKDKIILYDVCLDKTKIIAIKTQHAWNYNEKHLNEIKPKRFYKLYYINTETTISIASEKSIEELTTFLNE